MPVKPLELDDRTFADLFAEVRSLIPRYAPDWTDHNVSDPGIMVLELFAWLTEAMLYRINRISDASRARLLELLGAVFRPAQPAIVKLRVRWTQAEDSDPGYFLPLGTQILARVGPRGQIPFETLDEVLFTAQKPVRTVTLRQTQTVEARVLTRPTVGRPFELIPLGKEYFIPPPEPRPHRPQVLVDNKPWAVVDALRNPTPDGRCVALKPWLNAVAFGGGRKETGFVPPAGASIRVTYRWEPTTRGVVTDTFKSTGQPWQFFTLSRRFLGFDFQERGDLEPLLEVQEEADETWMPWEYVTNYLDMTRDAAQYTFEPWANAIRCGGGRYGRAPAASAGIRFSGRVTLGAGGNLSREIQSDDWVLSGVDKAARLTLAVESWETSTPGCNPTTLDEARLQVPAMLRPDWRTVTADDFVSVIRSQLPDIARVVPLPGRTPWDGPEQAERPGYVGVITIPDRTIEVNAPSRQLDRILASSAQSRRLVAADQDGATWLWNLDTRQPVSLPQPDAQAATFSPDGRRVLIVAQGAQAGTERATLWDALSGRLVHRVDSAPITDARARFSPTGRWLVTREDGRTQLRELEDGVLVHLLPAVSSWDHLAFGPDDASLAVANGEAVEWWNLASAGVSNALPFGGQVSTMTFSADGSRLAAASADGYVIVWQWRGAGPSREAEFHLDNSDNDRGCSLLLSANGNRLITWMADPAGSQGSGSAALWSVRTGALLADLSPDSPVSLLALSADGRWLATAHADQAVLAWDAATGTQLGEVTRGASVAALAFTPDRPWIVTVTTAPESKYTLGAWTLSAETIGKIALQEVAGGSLPVISRSGRWLAYADERLIHVWDLSWAWEITALYADFDDPAIVLDKWRLDPVDRLQTTAFGIQVAAAAPIALTAASHLRVASVPASPGVGNRTVQLWNAEHVYEAAKVIENRRLVTTRAEIAGPTYTAVTVTIIVVRSSPTIDPARLEMDVRAALAHFFDPMHGGPDGDGWPLGRPVYTSEICQVVEAVNGVDHVERVSPIVGQVEDPGILAIPPRSLVKSQLDVQVR